MKCPSVSGTNWLCWWEVSITWKVLSYQHILLCPLLGIVWNADKWCWYVKLKTLFLLTQLYSIEDIWMIFLTLLVVEIFSFQTSFILPIFQGTSLYGINILFDVSDAVLTDPSKGVLTFQKNAWLKNRYVWISFVLVLVAAIITAVVTLFEAESNRVPPSKAQLCCLWKMHRLQLLQ